jgi:hypothetical protein
MDILLESKKVIRVWRVAIAWAAAAVVVMTASNAGGTEMAVASGGAEPAPARYVVCDALAETPALPLPVQHDLICVHGPLRSGSGGENPAGSPPIKSTATVLDRVLPPAAREVIRDAATRVQPTSPATPCARRRWRSPPAR